MTTPRATYRLQFRGNMDFDRAAALVPYLARLGVSHLYASPVFRARSGSTHGYDVVEHGVLDPSLGGDAGWQRLTGALKQHGLGLILDLVPNHMAVSTENPWWADVLAWGSRSRWAGHFDIDWGAERLLLPILGEPYGEALAAGAIELRLAAEQGSLLLGYYDHALPLTPPSHARVFGASDDPRLHALARRFEASTPEQPSAAFAALRAALADPALRQAIEAAVAACNADVERLHDLHEAQPWRLGHWRLAREMLPYRRFFEIADLVGVRVEDPAVFRDVHARAVAMVSEGTVDGLRIDHIDGLADPKGYLQALRDACGAPYVVVEKILMPGETLPEDWAADGTTGYELGRLLAGVQVDPDGAQAFTHAWTGFTGEDPDYHATVRRAKRRILTVNLAGELAFLAALARRIAAGDRRTRDLGPDSLRIALVELVTELPVYRSYVDADGCRPADARLLTEAGDRAKRHPDIEDGRPVDFLVSLLIGADDPLPTPPCDEFVRRFQQTTGPVMAKAVEDTVFYRFNRLIALNEVGGEPEPFGLTVPAFHAAVAERARTQPRGLSATATHDTKRGEDGRIRIAVLSQQPDQWRADVERWHAATADLRTALSEGPAPDPNDEWLFYQSALGAWPADLDLSDAAALSDLAGRLEAFMIKALREAKRHTTWTAPNAAYEEATSRFVQGVFTHRLLLDDMAVAFAPLIAAGAVASLAQLALKLTLPGTPDIYQGTELLDLSLVDPDNRRTVDFDLRDRLLSEVPDLTPEASIERWRQGLAKLWLLHRLLALRNEAPAVFRDGTYEPLVVEGPLADRLVAFLRRRDGTAVAIAAPRLPLGLLRDPAVPHLDATRFDDTRLILPPSMSAAVGADHLAGEPAAVTDGAVELAPALGRFPVAAFRLTST